MSTKLGFILVFNAGLLDANDAAIYWFTLRLQTGPLRITKRQQWNF